MTTKMTRNGVTTTNTRGQEQYEPFWSSMMDAEYIQYDYRHTDGQLFSCIKSTLDACREARDKWLQWKADNPNGRAA